MLKPQAPRKPTAIPEPVPTRAGKVLRLAAIRSPPFPPMPLLVGSSKGNLNWASWRRLNLSAAVSARNSFWVRRVSTGAGAGAADEAGGVAVLNGSVGAAAAV